MRIGFWLALSAFLVLGSSCSDRTLSMGAAAPEFTRANYCGLEKDVFLVALYANRLSLPDSENVKLRHEEFMERLNSEQEEITKLIEEAFSKIGEREEKFKRQAQRFMGGHNSEECVYLKLRIAEILNSN